MASSTTAALEEWRAGFGLDVPGIFTESEYMVLYVTYFAGKILITQLYLNFSCDMGDDPIPSNKVMATTCVHAAQALAATLLDQPALGQASNLELQRSVVPYITQAISVFFLELSLAGVNVQSDSAVSFNCLKNGFKNRNGSKSGRGSTSGNGSKSRNDSKSNNRFYKTHHPYYSFNNTSRFAVA